MENLLRLKFSLDAQSEPPKGVNTLLVWNDQLLMGCENGCILVWKFEDPTSDDTPSKLVLQKNFIAHGSRSQQIRGHVSSQAASAAVMGLFTWNDYLCSASLDCSMNVWDQNFEKVKSIELGVHSIVNRFVGGLYYNNLIYVISYASFIRVYDNNLNLVKKMEGHRESVFSILLHKNLLWTGSQDKSIRLWKPDGSSYGLLSTTSEIFCLAVWNACDVVASSGTDKAITLWKFHGDGSDPKILPVKEKILKGHSSSVWSLVEYNSHLYSSSKFEILAWNHQGQMIGKLATAHEAWIRKLCIWKGFLWSASDDDTVKAWNERRPWEVVRLLYIANRKPQSDDCCLAWLPREIVALVITFMD